MPQMTVNLSPENVRKLEMFATRTGRSRDELLNHALEQVDIREAAVVDNWKAAWRHASGMWRDRDDLREFEETRQSWDRPYVFVPYVKQ
jgi:predicted transcriptional regulator